MLQTRSGGLWIAVVAAILCLVAVSLIPGRCAGRSEAFGSGTGRKDRDRSGSLSQPGLRRVIPVPHVRADVASAYASEEFVQVPDWIPRPANATSALAEDATLRSDGLQEGAVRLTFREDDAAAEIAAIMAHLESIGLQKSGDGAMFRSDDPRRSCTLTSETLPSGSTRVNLVYSGTDHRKSCSCPSCSEPPPESE